MRSIADWLRVSIQIHARMRIALRAIYICQFDGRSDPESNNGSYCVTRNTMANTGERQTRTVGREGMERGRRRASMKKKKKEKRKSRGLWVLRARCNDNAFCRMTDSFHIARGCCGCVGRCGDEATDKFPLSWRITNLKSDIYDNERGVLSKYAEET